MRKEKGSIAIFVLVALLFMSAFLIISFASNVNKSKTVKEQFNIISGIYAYTDGEEGAYDKAYSDLRNKNKQTMTASSENSSTLELTKTFDENMSNYRIYGNSIQDATPTPDNPVEVQSVGDLVTDTTDINYGKYKIPVKVTGTENNLLDFRKLQGITSYGSNNTSTKMIVSNNYKGIIIQCEPNTEYVLQLSKAISKFRFFYYDTEPIIENTISIGGAYYDSGSNVGSTVARFTTTSNAKWIGIALGTNEEMENTKVWLTKGTQEVEYEEYQGETCNIYLDEPLRKVGDAADYIDFKTGKVVRYIGKIDSYNGETITTSWISSTGELSTGATVYYVLDTPIEETVILPQLKSFEDCTKIEVLTSVAPSKIEVEYMGYTLE